MRTRKILLAEDDADDQKLFFDFLSVRTDVVLLPAAENGMELLKALQETADERLPDIIILDQNMPKCNGLQTLAALKQKPRYARLPVFIYSTYTDEHLVQSATAAGALAVLTKPVSKTGYEEMMKTILKAVS